MVPVERSDRLPGRKRTGHCQGRRHNLNIGGTNITASEASRKFLGVVPPHMPFWGYKLQREAYAILGVQATKRGIRRGISDSVAALHLTGRARAFIGL